MENVELCTRVSATLEGFVQGLRIADPNAGFGYSEIFDSAFWSLFSLLEGNPQGVPMLDSLRKRIDVLMDSLYLSAETRSILQSFRDGGVVVGGCTSSGVEALPRILGIALCETSPERRQLRAAEVVAVTHLSPVVVQASIGLSELFASSLIGEDTDRALARTLSVVEHPGVREALMVKPDIALSEVSYGDQVLDVVGSIVWAVGQTDQPRLVFKELVQQSDIVVVALGAAALGATGKSFISEHCPDLRSSEVARQILACRTRAAAT